ncbi:MAG: Gfo/Idh/MocA family oxidoreductase [Leptolyngbyaceae cyanobacterium bins.302]|nr:Gfo/Idh/MocA family oxidoreductase [Leptolyngbyaceae cyanobacterium bins.302]
MQVGLIGTGYAAKLRADTLQAETRAHLVAIAGRDLERTQTFSQPYGVVAYDSWQKVMETDADLVIVSTINQDHGAIVRAALRAGKHVIVEYPLCLDVVEAEALITLAKHQNKLLHVEHIELLGGVHQALKENLPRVGNAFYARYATLKPEHPAPQRWSYHAQAFGFPLMGALSRLHRLVDLFGTVATVSCTAQFWDATQGSGNAQFVSPSGYYTACRCSAQLQFANGVLAEVTYGKGEVFWQAERIFEVQGHKGTLIFEGDGGTWINTDGSHPLQVGSRRGLFARDTAMVLEHLTAGTPLYIAAEASVYTLKVADAARRSAEQGGMPINVGAKSVGAESTTSS